MRQFPLHFIYESNRTEGSRIPLSEVQRIFEASPTEHANKKEIQEVQNSYVVWHYLENGFQFSQRSIKRMYHLLTK